MPLKHSVEELILSNGARGLLIDVPATTSVFYEVQFRAGIRHAEDQQKSQVAHIMEHLAFVANVRFPSGEAFSQEFTKNAASHNAFTSNISMAYYVHAALMEWDRILELHLLAISQPVYTKKSLDAEKGNVREELAGNAGKNGRVLWQSVMRSAGLDRWYDAQEIKTIDAVELDDVTKHFNKTHTTENMRFVVAGNLKQHRQAIVESFETIPLRRGTRLPIPQETARPKGQVFIKRKDVPSLLFSLTFFLNRTLSLDERRSLGVLCYIITDTFHSRIFGVARTRGICYDMGSSYDSSATGVTDFSISGQVMFNNAPELFKLTIDVLNDIRKNGITDEELKQAKQYRLGSLQLSNNTIGSLADWYSSEYYESDLIDPIEAMQVRIEKTTSADVQTLLNELFDTGLWTLGGIGNSTAAEFTDLYKIFEEHITRKTIQ